MTVKLRCFSMHGSHRTSYSLLFVTTVILLCVLPLNALTNSFWRRARCMVEPLVSKSSTPLLGNVRGPDFVRITPDSGRHRRRPICSPLFLAVGSAESSYELAERYVSQDNFDLLTKRGRDSLIKLIHCDEGRLANKHVYGDWPDAGVEDEGKRRLTEKLADVDERYPGGVAKYIERARKLLEECVSGFNPFEQFTPDVPLGESLAFEDEGKVASTQSAMTFSEAEEVGLSAIGGLAFVVVAGGLGERLGFSDIKLSLETNLCTNESYLELYCSFIKALGHMAQKESSSAPLPIPLVIMTSGDTDERTRKFLAQNNHFGLNSKEIEIICQEKVPALKDCDGGLSLGEDRWHLQTKPHGHGDIHHLLKRHGFIEKWVHEHRSYVCFLQDTNGLAINAILPTLGVSITKKFHMNSICIPRIAGEATGAITRLTHKDDPSKSLTLNVEYNQLDPLLRGNPPYEGDVPDLRTGISKYPGNTNTLIFELGTYAQTLSGEDQGVVTEFINPKFEKGSRSQFKKPTRLECMMQDFPKLMQKELGNNARIGFTMLDRWLTFSPAKNSLESGTIAVNNGSKAPGTISSAESDRYIANQRMLRFAGVDVPVTAEKDKVLLGGIPVTQGPRIIISPVFAVTQKEIKNKVRGGRITIKSSLVLDGENLYVKNLDLDGALAIHAARNCHVTVDGLKVRNKGWELQEVDAVDTSIPETVKIRGYVMKKHDLLEFRIDVPGKYYIGEDGVAQKLD